MSSLMKILASGDVPAPPDEVGEHGCVVPKVWDDQFKKCGHRVARTTGVEQEQVEGQHGVPFGEAACVDQGRVQVVAE